MKIKICGITSLEDALAACAAGADALGFVFAPEARKRNRFIAPEAAREIIAALPPCVLSVAVTVNEPLDRLRDYLQFVDRVQLHGEEPASICRTLAPRAIKVFRAGPELDIAAMRQYPGNAYLLDAAAPGERGGAGVVCDWDIARRAVDAGLRIILAGGLTPENAAEAARRVRPYAMDVSGGVECAPGKKDHEKMRQFIQNARSAVA